MPLTTFRPEVHGFLFENNFRNAIALGIETKGRCGGMAYLALDYFNSRIPVPTHEPQDFGTEDEVPPDGSVLASLIFARLLDTFADNVDPWASVYGPALVNDLVKATSNPSSGLGIVNWVVNPVGQVAAWLAGKIVDVATRSILEVTKDAIPILRRHLSEGKPMPLALIHNDSITDSGKSHQVVAYDSTLSGTLAEILVYDNNHPGSPVTLTTDFLRPDVITYSTGETWAGFFVEENYSPKMPPYLDLAIANPGITAQKDGPVRESWKRLVRPGKIRSFVKVATQLHEASNPLRIDCKVRNFGEFNAHYAVIRVVVDGPVPSATVLQGDGDETLSPGQELSLSHTIPSFSTPGFYTIRLHCDRKGSLPTAELPVIGSPNRAITVEVVPQGHVPRPAGPPPGKIDVDVDV
jgi:hypothetical protein